MQAERRFLARTDVDCTTGVLARKRSLERRVRLAGFLPAGSPSFPGATDSRKPKTTRRES